MGRRDEIDNYDAVTFDIVYAYAYAAEMLLASGESLTGENMAKYLRLVNFTGITGPFLFDQQGNRVPVAYNVVNFRKGRTSPQIVGSWTSGNLQVDDSILEWPSGSNVKPDLNETTPRKYWSCHQRRRRVDPTGYAL